LRIVLKTLVITQEDVVADIDKLYSELNFIY